MKVKPSHRPKIAKTTLITIVTDKSTKAVYVKTEKRSLVIQALQRPLASALANKDNNFAATVCGGLVSALLAQHPNDATRSMTIAMVWSITAVALAVTEKSAHAKTKTPNYRIIVATASKSVSMLFEPMLSPTAPHAQSVMASTTTATERSTRAVKVVRSASP